MRLVSAKNLRHECGPRHCIGTVRRSSHSGDVHICLGGAHVNPIGSLRASVAFLSRIPVGSSPLTANDISWSPAFFPLVGAALGGAVSLVFTLLAPLGSIAAAALAVGFSCYVTGAFHEDGMADTADGLGGAVSRERALAIMKDSRIGTYGAVALTITLLSRVGLLVRIAEGTSSEGAMTNCLAMNMAILTPVVLSGALGRLAAVWLMTYVAHADPSESKTKDLVAVAGSRAWLATGLVLSIATAVFATYPAGVSRIIVAVGLTTGIAFLMARLSLRRLGGITGDVLGATEQICEVAVLAAFAWRS